MSIEKINWALKKPDDFGLFHDSRSDVRTLAKAVMMLRDKINELVEQNNRQAKEISELKKP